VLPARLPLPALGGRADERAPGARGRVINLWASWCRPCLAELTEWTEQAEKLRQARLDVVALCVDRLDETAGDPQRARQSLRRLEFPFATDWATTQSVGRLDLFQRAMLDRWQPLSVPCTFLLDERGDVAVIYKGRVSAEQLVQDAQLLEASPERLRQAAVPFAGRWISPPPEADPLRVVSQMIDHTQVRSGIDYLRQFAAARAKKGVRTLFPLSRPKSATSEKKSPDPFFDRQLADTMRVLGILLEEQGKNAEALDAYRQAVAAWPDDVRMRTDLGQLALKQNRPDEAVDQWQAALKINPADALLWARLGMLHAQRQQHQRAAEALSQAARLRPDDAILHFQLGNALRKAGQVGEAIAHYERAVELDQRLLPAANNLAWIRATHPDARYRNGPQAVKLAEQLCQATGRRNPTFLDTLAAAYAEVGRFDEAVATAAEALNILAAATSDQGDLAAALRQRLRQYQARQPYRDPSNG